MIRSRLSHTPYLDAWRETLRTATDGPGKKTALAHFMADARGQELQTWRVGIRRIMDGKTIPNGEDVLAISAWIHSQASAPAKTTRKATTTKHGRHRPTSPGHA